MSSESQGIRFGGSMFMRPTAEGGRGAPISSGYRPLAHFSRHGRDFLRNETANAQFHGVQIEVGGPPIEPGASAAVTIQPMFPEYWPGLVPGQVIELYEGPHWVGTFTMGTPDLGGPQASDIAER